MLTLTLNEQDPHLLRVTASYLLALAAPAQAQNSEADTANQVAIVHNQIVDELGRPAPFTNAELAEMDALHPAGYDAEARQAAEAQRTNVVDAAAIFGGKSAPSTVAADQSPTALVETPVVMVEAPKAVLPPPAVSPPLAVAPVAPPTASPAPGVELDVRGLPWDSRIHSREKTKLASGAWKYKRGVPEKIVADVEAELTGLMAIPAAPVTTVVAPPPLVHAEVVTPPPSSPVVAPPPATTAVIANPSSEPFPALMTKVASAIAARKLNQGQVIAIVQGQGVPSLPGLIQRPDLIPNIEAAIDAQIMMNEASGVAQ